MNPDGRTYLRLSITERCSFRCRYCRPPDASTEGGRTRRASDAELLELVRLVHEETGVRKLRLTGGEPLLYPRAAELTASFRALLPDATLAATTNGALLGETARAIRAAGLDCVNVSLDSLDADRFREVTCGGSLDATLLGIRAAVKAGFAAVKINTVLIQKTNGDQLPRLVRFAAKTGCEIRFIELMPLGPGAALYRSDFLAADDALATLRQALQYVSSEPSTGTATRHRFLADGRPVVVGLIAPVSEPFCSRCDRLRLDRAGRLYACLRQSSSVDLLAPLRADDERTVRLRIRESLCGKGEPAAGWPMRQMVTIGG